MPKFDETKSVERAKEFLLNAIRGEGVIHTAPAQDAANYANAYHALVIAEKTRTKKDVDK